MRFFLLVTGFLISMQLTAQQEPGCKTNLALDARLDSVLIPTNANSKPSDSPAKKDAAKFSPTGIVDYIGGSTHYFIIKPPADSYKILSFTISCQQIETGDIVSIACKGDTISHLAINSLFTARDNPVDITCIKARHPNGVVFTLRDLHFPSARIFRR